MCPQLLMLMPLQPGTVALLLLTLVPLHSSGETVSPEQVSHDRIFSASCVSRVIADKYFVNSLQVLAIC